MEPTKPQVPSEAVELYNLFIHGVISRRAFMDGVQKFAVGGLAVATLIEALMPNYALGQQVSKTDDRIKASLRNRSIAERERKHQRISGPACQRRHPIRDADEITWHHRGPRKSGPESAYRGRRAAARAAELHGVRSRRTHLTGRLSR